MNIDTLITHSPALIVAVPLLGAFLTPLVGRISELVRNIWVVFIAAVTSFFVFLLSADVLNIFNDEVGSSVRTYVFGAADKSDPVVRILFEVDGINAFMIIIGAILLFVAVIYSWSFMKDQTGLDKYYTLILLMSAGMFGMMLTGDMFNFFVFLEITSIASCALIAFWTNKGKAVEAGFKYIVISTIGALFILLAIAILYSQYNALNMSVIASNISYSFLDKIALVLLVSGLAMKAGIVPMHMWLPDAYGRAPASVTVVLVGTTLASLYALIRIIFSIYGNAIGSISAIKEINIFGETYYYVVETFFGYILVILAVFTIIIGVLMALKQINLKRMIAFTAVAEIGYMLLAIGSKLAATYVQKDPITSELLIFKPEYGTNSLYGGVFHIFNDALDIGLLFLVAGAIYYATKETSLNKMGGLARNMKYTTVFFIIGLLAVSGMPPMNGFASKLMIYESTYQINPILGIIAVLCSIFLLAVFIKVLHSAFLGPKIPRFDDVKEVPKSMLLAMGIIACLIIFFGMFPELILENIVQPAADALIDYGSYVNFGGI